MTDEEIEQKIKAAGADKAPRVTPQDLQDNIYAEHYFTAADAVTYNAGGPQVVPDPSLKLLTFCVLVLRNGFTVVGQSAVASPENFNADVGRDVARTDAINKLWPLMGYALKESLYQSTTTKGE